MTTYICKCGRRVKKSTDASTTGNRLSGYAPGHECWGCPYAMPYGNYQWDESARTVSRETQGYECRMSKTLTYASEFAGSIKDKCTCRVHSLDFDFLSQVSAWIKDTYPDREIFGSFSKDIRASDYGSDGRYCLTITCTQNLKGVAAKRELLGQFFTPNGSRKDMTPQQEMEKILADIKKAKEIFSCTPAQNADAAATMTSPAASSSAAAIPTTSASEAAANGWTPALSPQSSASAPVVPAETSFASAAVPSFDFSALGDLSQQAADADQQFDLHYGAAQDEYLISCIYLARIHTLTAKAGRYGGGYYIGFLVVAFLISLFCRKWKNVAFQTAFLIVVGIPVIYAFGAGWMKHVTGQPWGAVIVQSIIPFIPLDIVKCVAAVALGKALKRTGLFGN